MIYTKNRQLGHLEHYIISKDREIKSNGNYFLRPESKVLFVIRVRGIVEINPKVHKVLKLL